MHMPDLDGSGAQHALTYIMRFKNVMLKDVVMTGT